MLQNKIDIMLLRGIKDIHKLEPLKTNLANMSDKEKLEALLNKTNLAYSEQILVAALRTKQYLDTNDKNTLLEEFPDLMLQCRQIVDYLGGIECSGEV